MLMTNQRPTHMLSGSEGPLWRALITKSRFQQRPRRMLFVRSLGGSMPVRRAMGGALTGIFIFGPRA